MIYGGPSMSVSKLSEELCKNGLQVEVFTTLANGRTELNFPPGKLTYIENVPVWFFKRITKDHSHFSPALFKHLISEIKKTNEPLIIHIHAWWNLVSIFACLVARFYKIPVVLSPRGTLSNYSFQTNHNFIKKWIHLLLGKKLLSNCNFHCTSGVEKNEIVQFIHSKKIQVIPNFVAIPSQLKSYTKSENPILKLLFLSRIEAKKGLEVLLQALAGIDFPYQLTIAGTGEMDYIQSLQNLVTKNSMEAFVTWIGFQDHESKFEVLQAHDLLILPSYNENFGNVVIESLAVGTPVLISDQVGLANYVTANKLGWTFENKPEKLREQLTKINQNRFELDEIKLQSPKKIRKDFAEEALIKQYVNFYHDVISGSK